MLNLRINKVYLILENEERAVNFYLEIFRYALYIN